MSRLRLLGWAAVLAVVPSFLLARVHPFGDPGLYSRAMAADPIPAHTSMPEGIRAVLNAKCADCHSSRSQVPLYGRLAPVSWFIERDIIAARTEMNLSDWSSYTPEQQDIFKSKMLRQIRSGSMPPLQYRVIHRSTHITARDNQVLTAWAHAAPVIHLASTPLAGDPARGKALFEKRCTGCHSLSTNHEGPRLQGVFGRPSASISGFPYSAALRQAHIVWNDESLDRWLTEPDSFIPNSNMDFRVPSPQERKDLIAYLRATMTER